MSHSTSSSVSGPSEPGFRSAGTSRLNRADTEASLWSRGRTSFILRQMYRRFTRLKCTATSEMVCDPHFFKNRRGSHKYKGEHRRGGKRQAQVAVHSLQTHTRNPLSSSTVLSHTRTLHMVMRRSAFEDVITLNMLSMCCSENSPSRAMNLSRSTDRCTISRLVLGPNTYTRHNAGADPQTNSYAVPPSCLTRLSSSSSSSSSSGSRQKHYHTSSMMALSCSHVNRRFLTMKEGIVFEGTFSTCCPASFTKSTSCLKPDSFTLNRLERKQLRA
jgi:hypothetical protein